MKQVRYYFWRMPHEQVCFTDDYNSFLMRATGIFNCSRYFATVLLPLSILPGLLYFKHMQNYFIDERRERLVPLFFAAICYYIGYYLVTKLAPVRVINLFLFASTVVVLMILFVSLFWKISIHMAGICGGPVSWQRAEKQS